MNLESIEFWLLAFGAVLAIYGVFMAFSRWCLNSPAVPAEKLSRLRLGLLEREVVELLGKPFREGTWRNLPEWHYGHRLKRHLLILRFDAGGRLRHFQQVSDYDPEHHELS